MRTTISIDDEIAEMAERIMAREVRNFSNLCEVALREYFEARDIPTDGIQRAENPLAEVMSAASEIGMTEALEILRRAARRRKSA